MMRYSKAIIDDYNFDEEHEKLCDLIGISHTNDVDVYKVLPSGFMEQEASGENGEPLGFSEWVMSKTAPNKGSDFRQALQVGEVAYQFGNIFLSKHYEVVL